MWPTLVEFLNTQGAKVPSTCNLRYGIHLLPSTDVDYRGIVALLGECSRQHYCYQLPEGKPVMIVLRGPYTLLPIVDFETALRGQRFHPPNCTAI
ncbi:hypothetical protein Zmor_004153 [Zophobas morio]|uniref:Uncharacterized protein n=1 Tax=Zophobas morio TaxID=2755281 RepID=A0AA38LZR0_9CUCU|nr:hypothetical protein Zmor_004153 [Zophobas morio]